MVWGYPGFSSSWSLGWFFESTDLEVNWVSWTSSPIQAQCRLLLTKQSDKASFLEVWCDFYRKTIRKLLKKFTNFDYTWKLHLNRRRWERTGYFGRPCWIVLRVDFLYQKPGYYKPWSDRSAKPDLYGTSPNSLSRARPSSRIRSCHSGGKCRPWQSRAWRPYRTLAHWLLPRNRTRLRRPVDFQGPLRSLEISCKGCRRNRLFSRPPICWCILILPFCPISNWCQLLSQLNANVHLSQTCLFQGRLLFGLIQNFRN